MEITMLQIILLTLLSGWAIYDQLHGLLGFALTTTLGFVSGIIMGDPITGLYIGGSLNLLSLGVASYGGASVPDYKSAAILGTAFAVSSGQSPELAVSLALPIGVLLIQMDVLARFTNVFFLKRAEKAYRARKYEWISRYNMMGILSWIASRMIPVFIGLMFGVDVVSSLVDKSPVWLIDGLNVAGGLIPALGIAILMRYLPLENYIAYFIIGFVLSAYLQIPLMGITLIGLGVAILIFQNSEKNSQVVATTANTTITIDDSSEEVMGDE